MSKRKEVGEGEVKKAVENLVGALEEELQFKEQDLAEEVKLLTLQLETRRKELNQLRQQLHSLEQKWR